MIRYKIDVLDALKDKGYTTYRISKEKLISGATMQRIRDGVVVAPLSLDVLCRLLDLPIGEIIEYVKDPE